MKVIKSIYFVIKCLINVLKNIWKSNIFKVILLCVIVLLILIDYWGLSLFGTTINYERFGTVGDWFSNFATIITIIFAAITIRNDRLNAERDRKFTLELRDQEEKKNLQEIEKRQELQEKSVYVWVGGKQDIVTHSMNKLWVCISNKTNAPIFEWEIINEKELILISSLEYGPIFGDVQDVIEVDGLSIDTKVKIRYKSFSGKWYFRDGAEIWEVENA